MYLSLVPLQTNRKLSVGWPQLLSRRNSIIVIEFAKWLDCSCWTLGKAGKTTSMANGWNPYFCSVVKLCESGFVQKPGTTQIIAIWPFQLNIWWLSKNKLGYILFSDIPNSAVWDVFCQVRTRMQIKFDNNRHKQETGVMEWMDWAWFSLAIQRTTGLIMFTLEPLNVRASHKVDFHPFAIWTFCNFWQLLWF